MTPVSELSFVYLTVFEIIASFPALGAVLFLVGGSVRRLGRKYIISASVMFPAAMFIFLGIIDLGAKNLNDYRFNYIGNAVGSMPWAVLALVLTVTMAAEAVGIASAFRRGRNRLSAGPVKESLDALPDGVCFFAPDGQPLLINRQMNRISSELYDREILNAETFIRRLRENVPEDRATLIRTSPNITVRTAKGRVWEFHREELTVGKSEIYELIAADITEQYGLTEELEKRNERLSRVNERLRLFSREMVTLTAEKELLDAKIKVHDNVGRCLLYFRSYLAQSREKRDRKKLLFMWEYVISVMKKETLPFGEWDQIGKTAEMLGISVELDGDLPENLKIRTAVVSAMCECLTNTASHAGGDKLFVKLRTDDGAVSAELTNTGRVPDGEIREGGGLKNLRRVVEQAGGVMTVESAPRFLLRLDFPKGDKDEWLSQEY